MLPSVMSPEFLNVKGTVVGFISARSSPVVTGGSSFLVLKVSQKLEKGMYEEILKKECSKKPQKRNFRGNLEKGMYEEISK